MLQRSRSVRSQSPPNNAQQRPATSPLRARAPTNTTRFSSANVPSASEELAAELKEAESKLRGLESSLGGLRRAVAKKRNQLKDDKAERSHELAAEEEAMTVQLQQRSKQESIRSGLCQDLVTEEEALQQRLWQAEARHVSVEAAVSSDLYWRWKGIFETHLRAGGRFDDFSLDDFFHDYYGVTKAAKLEVPRNETERLVFERAALAENATELHASEADLRTKLAGLVVEVRNLKGELQSQEDINYACWQGQLSDKPRLHELRGQQNELGLIQCELEAEVAELRRRGARADQYIRLHQSEADDLRAHILPCEELISVLEHSFEINQEHGERFKQTIEMKEYELGRSKILRTWKREMRRLDGTGPELQQEALTFLQEAAQEVQERDWHKEEMEALVSELRDCQREATQLNDQYQHTSRLLASTTEDLDGLEYRHDELCAATERAASLLDRAESSGYVASPQRSKQVSNVADTGGTASPGSHLKPMDRAKALALAQSPNRSDIDTFLMQDTIGAGVLARAARAAHAKAVPRPLPMSSSVHSVGNGANSFTSGSPYVARFEGLPPPLSLRPPSDGSKGFRAI